jgi:CRP/FNR family cyclic AMP-dependent transcriptional regulator
MGFYWAVRNHAFAKGLSDEQVSLLAALASEVIFNEDEVILADGQRSTHFYLLTEGSVAVELRAARYTIVVQSLGAGQVFGWSALLDHQDTLFQVRARERTAALRINGGDLWSLCRTDAGFGAEIFQRTLNVVAGRVKATEQRFAEMCGIRA